IADWLDRLGFTSPRLRWLGGYACRDDYGTPLDETSAWAGLFYFASRMRAPGAEPQPLMTWPEGKGRLGKHPYSEAKDKGRIGLAAADIVPTDAAGRRGVDVIAVDAADNGAHGFRAERVIFAAPHFLTRFLLRPYRDDPPQHVAEFEYGAWLVANLFLK